MSDGIEAGSELNAGLTIDGAVGKVGGDIELEMADMNHAVGGIATLGACRMGSEGLRLSGLANDQFGFSRISDGGVRG